MKKIKVGVLGLFRGTSMINYCIADPRAELVAICDKWDEGVALKKAQLQDDSITFYSSFDEFIEHDMDAVVLANYAHQHAPFAIRCLKKGLHVFSEVLPCQTMKEAVELIEAVEESGKVYAFGENYCYMAGPHEMRELYRAGELGEFEYGEGEYVHNCDPIWHSITYGERDHWRNNMYANFYCTHSLGPIIHITGLRPVSVIGLEGTKNERRLDKGAKGGQFGMEMVTLENGGIIKSIHGDLYRNSVWYSIYGGKGRMETARYDAEAGRHAMLYVNTDDYPYQYKEDALHGYKPLTKFPELEKGFGHGGSDFYCMYHFIDRLAGNEDAEIIDVYEAMDMFLPGLFAYRSVLQGNIPMEVPNLRDKAQRDKYRNDTACTDPEVAGDQLLPTFSKGTPEIPDSVYEKVKKHGEEELADGTGRAARVLGALPKKKN